ncbi:MAG: aminoglycoside phosphotransferase family protein [Actinobacteria bacterium]|nr:aminoglycoside phosphotransferase family protein [Actinomycetota bacterium]
MRKDTLRLLARAGLDPEGAVEMGGGSGTSVLRIGGVVAKHYRPGFDDWSGLGPAGTADKVAGLAAALPSRGVPVPHVMARADDGDGALVVWEAVEAGPLTPEHRVEAARVLRRLHGIPTGSLPGEVGALVLRSRRNGDRIRLGVEQSAASLDSSHPGWRDGGLGRRTEVLLAAGEPPPGESLVHGDYFSVNLLAGGPVPLVADWDLASPGDPMWDLAFLVGADRGLPRDVVTQVLDAYGPEGMHHASLAWHVECWALFWLLRDLAGTLPSGPAGAASSG